MALWAASEAGFVVFAGCLEEESLKTFTDLFPNLFPVKLDVTKDEDVELVAGKVAEWLKEDVGQKRAFHALVNNAGVGVLGEVDWMHMDGYRKCMEGEMIVCC